MAHDHDHGNGSAFYTEQLFTIGVCGAFAGVTLLLWYSGTLNNMLHPKFHIWVLLGGAALLAMVVVNAVSLWFAAGAKAVPVHDHDHDHGHDHDHAHDHDHHHGNGHVHDHAHGDHVHCNHDHAHDHVHAHHDHAHAHVHAETAVQTTSASVQQGAPVVAAVAAPLATAPACADGCGHDHDHGWAPWRYAVLLLPVAIYFVFPLEALSGSSAKAVEVVEPTGSGVDKKQEDFAVTFLQLETAALYKDMRDDYEGKTVRISGRYIGDGDKRFTLVRYKINCCAADAIPLDAVILLDSKAESKEKLDANRLRNRWVQVIGRVQFVKKVKSDEYATALILSPTKDKPLSDMVKEVPPDANPYAN